MAQDVGNTKKIGDKATIEACRPISKNKSFKVIA
jgi:ribosomal protein S17